MGLGLGLGVGSGVPGAAVDDIDPLRVEGRGEVLAHAQLDASHLVRVRVGVRVGVGVRVRVRDRG